MADNRNSPSQEPKEISPDDSAKDDALQDLSSAPAVAVVAPPAAAALSDEKPVPPAVLLLLEKTFQCAKYMFPGLFEGKDHLQPSSFVGGKSMSPIDRLKSFISDSVDDKVQDLSEPELERLMKRENAADFCRLLGMNEEVVQKKFGFTARFEKELHITGKMPILLSISFLIETLDEENPYGSITDGIVAGFNEKDGLCYMGVSLEVGSLNRSIQTVEQALKKIPIDIEKAFMHGTTGGKLGQAYEKGGQMKVSEGKHDFGPGIYCFRGRLLWALSWAVDRSWPRDGKQDNPSVIIFPNADFDEGTFTHVNEYSVDNFTKEELSQTSLKEYLKQVENYKTDKLWKQFVKLARVYEEVPGGTSGFWGSLHDCETTALTDQCREPMPDGDGWEQYCFLKNRTLGNNRIFVELHMDWDSWMRNEPELKKLKRLEKKGVVD